MVPLKDENALLLRKDLNGCRFSNAIGIPLIALLQGGGFVGYLDTALKSRILVCDHFRHVYAVPAIELLLHTYRWDYYYLPTDRRVKALLCWFYGFGVIGTVDNVFRFGCRKKIEMYIP